MAYYAALVSVVQLLEEISQPDHPYRNFFLEGQITSLCGDFILLRTSIGDYQPKVDFANSFDIPERRIRDVAYRAKDIIESHISKEKTTDGDCEKTKPQQLEELEEVKKEVDLVLEHIMKLEQRSTLTEILLSNKDSSEGASQVQRKKTLVGFDKELEKMKAQLCGESSGLEVISIVAMGGTGKTTLARHIFDDKLTHDRFDRRAWVTVSQKYHLQKVLQGILDSMEKYKRRSSGVLEVDSLIVLIHQHLKGRRYLIVIDDMWDTQIWDDIRRAFPNDGNGSRVVITTRIRDVAEYASTDGFIHLLQFRNEKQSWDLFRSKVLCPPELEYTGRSIVNCCGGLPLAIVLVAGFLSKICPTCYDWGGVASNVMSAVVHQNDERMMKVLSLSYDYLPHHLKSCLLHLGGFPEDGDIPVSKLIMLWVAEGFLKPTELKSSEEVGEKYLEDLVSRNLVLITKRRSNGEFKYCNMHDLLREMCLQRARFENFLHLPDEDDCFSDETDVRRLYIHQDSSFLIDRVQEFCSHVHSILLFADVGDQFLSVASKVKLLRVLDALDIRTTSFPHEIVQLLHLRFLALQDTIHPIPPSISQLKNLQTLILFPSGYYETGLLLPNEIWKMPNLRHVVGRALRLPPIPYGESSTGGVPLLGSLRTLSKVVNFLFTRDTVEMIRNLKKLRIHYTGDHSEMWRFRGEIWRVFRLDNLVHFCELRTLEIEFYPLFRYGRSFFRYKPLPESFSFPVNLEKLSLEGCDLPWSDMTAIGSLPNLQVLKLRTFSFMGEEWNTVEGEFPRLMFLLMESLDLKYWRTESTHFPRLQHLEIKECKELEEIPPEIGEISNLESIEIYYCDLAADSARRIQEEQRELGNVALQVRVYSYLRIKVDAASGSFLNLMV